MTLRFRRMDVFAVVGILALLAWAPTYWAQSEDERAHSGTYTFHVPQPQDGDQANFSLVVRAADDEPRRIDGFAEVTRRLVTPGEVPVSAHWVEEVSWPSHSVRLGDKGTFVQHEGTQRTYFDREGRTVWESGSTAEGHLQGPDGAWHRAVHEYGRARSGFGGDSAEVFGRQVTYEPDRFALVWLNVQNDVAATAWESGLADTRPDDDFGDLVVRFEDRSFYGTQNNVYSRILPGATGANGGGGVLDLEGVRFNMAEGLIDLDEPTGWAIGFAYSLYHPDWAGLAGRYERMEHQDSRETLLEWVVAPSEWTRGSGEPLPVHRPKEAYQTGPPFEPTRVPPREDRRHEMVSVADVSEDQRPLVRGISVADLREALRGEESPTSVRESARNGILGGFAWELDPPRIVRRSETEPPVLPPPLGEETRRVVEETYWVSRFVVAVVAPDGVPTVAEVVVNETSNGSKEVQVRDLCRTSYTWAGGEIASDCRRVDEAHVAPTRQVLPPEPFLRAIRRETGREAPTSFVWSSVDGVVADAFGNLEAEGPLGIRPYTLGYGRGATPERPGIAAWRHLEVDDDGVPRQEERGALHPSDAGLLSWQRSDAIEAGADPEPSLAIATEPIQRLDPLPRTAATAGILLVAVSVAVRLWAALAAGAHHGLITALYARVSKDAALVHERRQEIVDLLETDPGLTTTELARRLGYSYNATVHHLETLRRTGHLVHVQEGRRRHFFVPGTADRRERLRMSVARDPEKARFLAMVERHPGLSLQELVDHVPQRVWSASRTGKALAELGLVEKRRDGKAVRFYPAEEAATPGA